MKITFMGAGSTVFARNVIGDCMCTEALRDSVFALYDIDATRLEESRTILEAMRSAMGGYGKIECYLGVEQRKEALRGARFVINAKIALNGPLILLLKKVANATFFLATKSIIADKTAIPKHTRAQIGNLSYLFLRGVKLILCRSFLYQNPNF